MPDRAAVAGPGAGIERGAARVPPAADAPATTSGALDPRSKLLLVVLVSIAVMGPHGTPFIVPALVLAIVLALGEAARRRAIGIIGVAVLLWALGWVVPMLWQNSVTAILAIACAYLIRFAAAIGVGMHVIATTSPTQLSAALRAWHAPRVIAVTLATMLRFFPVVATEAAAVVDAMRLRGLTGAGGVLRHPILSIERFVVPMIAASLRAGEDLAASAILRGLGSHHRPTAMVAPRFGRADLALLIGIAGLAALALTLPSPLDALALAGMDGA